MMRKLAIVVLMLLLAGAMQAGAYESRKVVVKSEIIESEYGKLGELVGFGDRLYKTTYNDGTVLYQLIRTALTKPASIAWIQNNILVGSGQRISIGYTVKGTNIDGQKTHTHEIELYDDDTKSYLGTKTWDLEDFASRGDSFIIQSRPDGTYNFFIKEFVYLIVCENSYSCSYKRVVDVNNEAYTKVTVGSIRTSTATPTPTPTATLGQGQCKDSYGNIYICTTSTATPTPTPTATLGQGQCKDSYGNIYICTTSTATATATTPPNGYITATPTETTTNGDGIFQTLWWYDDTHKYCQQNTFTGSFVYYGLHTYKTEAECKAALEPTFTATATPTPPVTAPATSTSTATSTIQQEQAGAILYKGVDITIGADGYYYVGDIPHDSLAEARKTIDELMASKEQTKSPGFEAVFAIAGLVAVAYLVLRQKK